MGPLGNEDGKVTLKVTWKYCVAFYCVGMLYMSLLFGAADPVQLSGRFARARLDSDDILLVIGRWNQKTWIELPTRLRRLTRLR